MAVLWDRGDARHVPGSSESVRTAESQMRDDPVRVSPTGFSVTAHGETPPALEILPGGVLVVAEPPRQVAPGGRYPRWAAWGKDAILAFTCGAGGGSQVIIADGVAALNNGWMD